MDNQNNVKRRVAFVLIDGLGDVSLPRFGHRTPLEVANVPNLDAIASAGVNGLMDPVEAGLACGSDTAHLSLLGYDPRVYYRGRGAFESMGAGLAMSPGDIAFKSNFATIDENTGIVTSRRADRHFEEEGPILCAALDGLKLLSFPEYEVRVRYATEHRCGVVVKGPKLSGNISGTDPLKDNRLLLKAEALDDTEEARYTAAVVNELSKEISRILVSHPLNASRAAEGKNIANVVLLRGCGIRIEINIGAKVITSNFSWDSIGSFGMANVLKLKESGPIHALLGSSRCVKQEAQALYLFGEVPSFEKQHGLSSCMVAPTKIIAGLGMSLGIDILEAPGATGDYRTQLTSKATAIAKALSSPLQPCPSIFVPGEDEHKPGPADGYDFGFLHIKLRSLLDGLERGKGHVLSKVLLAIDDAGHDKASILKVRALEAVDCAIGQLTRLLWQAEKTGKFQYYVCVTGDHSTPAEYGDHSFEPVPFALCRLSSYVNAVGEAFLMKTSLDAFPLPSVKAGEDLQGGIGLEEKGSTKCKAFSGDSVCQFDELAAAKGCLGRFPGSERMGIIKKFLKLKND